MHVDGACTVYGKEIYYDVYADVSDYEDAGFTLDRDMTVDGNIAKGSSAVFEKLTYEADAADDGKLSDGYTFVYTGEDGGEYLARGI